MDILNGNTNNSVRRPVVNNNMIASDEQIARLYSKLDALEKERDDLKARLSRQRAHIREKYGMMQRKQRCNRDASRSRSRNRTDEEDDAFF